MDDIKGIRTPILNQGSPEELREKIRHYFHQTFTMDEKLYELIANESGFYLRPDPLRHPLVFYLGHTAVFFINKLNIANIISTQVNPQYETMLAIGVDEMSWDDLDETHYNWPSIPEVRVYRDKVRALVDEVISTLPMPEGGITWDSPWWAIMMGIEHQRIHLETSSVLIRHLRMRCWLLAVERSGWGKIGMIPFTDGTMNTAVNKYSWVILKLPAIWCPMRSICTLWKQMVT
jgi:hypothetical protein